VEKLTGDRRTLHAPQSQYRLPFKPQTESEPMAITPKRTRLSGYASQRELIDLAKTMDLDAIVRKTGRTRQNILTSAKRLGIKIKGRNTA
jgi:ribosomal protein L11